MNFNLNRKSAVAVFLALTLVSAAVGGAAAATATIDTETTNSAATTDLNAGETQHYNETKNRNLTVQVDSKDFSVNITDDGHEILQVENDSSIVTHVNSNSTAGTHTYNITLSNDASDYDGVSVAPGGNDTLTINIINNTAADSPTVTTKSYYYNNTKTQGFVRTTSGDTKTVAASGGVFSVAGLSIPAPDVSMAPEVLSGIFGSSSTSDTSSSEFNGSAQVTEDVNMTSSTDTVNVDFENASSIDAAANALEASSAGHVTFAYAQFDGKYVPVVSSTSDAPDWVDTSSATYITLNKGGATVHNANETTTSDTTVVLTLNEKISGDVYDKTLSNAGLKWWKVAQKTAFDFDTNGNPAFGSA